MYVVVCKVIIKFTVKVWDIQADFTLTLAWLLIKNVFKSLRQNKYSVKSDFTSNRLTLKRVYLLV